MCAGPRPLLRIGRVLLTIRCNYCRCTPSIGESRCFWKDYLRHNLCCLCFLRLRESTDDLWRAINGAAKARNNSPNRLVPSALQPISPLHIQGRFLQFGDAAGVFENRKELVYLVQ
jgi:hypothetical protein